MTPESKTFVLTLLSGVFVMAGLMVVPAVRQVGMGEPGWALVVGLGLLLAGVVGLVFSVPGCAAKTAAVAGVALLAAGVFLVSENAAETVGGAPGDDTFFPMDVGKDVGKVCIAVGCVLLGTAACANPTGTVDCRTRFIAMGGAVLMGVGYIGIDIQRELHVVDGPAMALVGMAWVLMALANGLPRVQTELQPIAVTSKTT